MAQFSEEETPSWHHVVEDIAMDFLAGEQVGERVRELSAVKVTTYPSNRLKCHSNFSALERLSTQRHLLEKSINVAIDEEKVAASSGRPCTLCIASRVRRVRCVRRVGQRTHNGNNCNTPCARFGVLTPQARGGGVNTWPGAPGLGSLAPVRPRLARQPLDHASMDPMHDQLCTTSINECEVNAMTESPARGSPLFWWHRARRCRAANRRRARGSSETALRQTRRIKFSQQNPHELVHGRGTFETRWTEL